MLEIYLVPRSLELQRWLDNWIFLLRNTRVHHISLREFTFSRVAEFEIGRSKHLVAYNVFVEKISIKNTTTRWRRSCIEDDSDKALWHDTTQQQTNERCICRKVGVKMADPLMKSRKQLLWGGVYGWIPPCSMTSKTHFSSQNWDASDHWPYQEQFQDFRMGVQWWP